MGANVDKRIDTMVAALSFGATLEDLSNLDIAYAPPFNGPIDNLATAANVLHNNECLITRQLYVKKIHVCINFGDFCRNKRKDLQK